MEVKTTLAQDCKKALVRFSSSVAQTKHILVNLCVWSSEVKYLSRWNMYFCYGHKSSTGTIQRLILNPKSYDFSGARPATGIKNGTILSQLFKHRMLPGEVKVLL